MKCLLEESTWLDAQQQAMIDLVIELCDINSGTFNLEGLKKVAEILVREFSELGGDLQVLDSDVHRMVNDDGQDIEQPLGQMIHISKWPDAEKRILLCIHMDTVYGTFHPFNHCSWLSDGNLKGPGVADAKGGLVVMLNALKALEQSSFAGQVGWEVLINPDEEIGSPGSSRKIVELAPKCDYGLLFEPALPDGTLVSWRKGTGNFTFVVEGRPAHAGREFEKGRNAVAALSRLFAAIDDLNTDPEVTFNVGRVKGGGPLNMVPYLAVGGVNVRVKTVEQQHAAEQCFRELVAQFNQKDGISVRMEGCFSSPPKQLCDRTEVLQRRIETCGRQIGIDVKWRGTGGASDGNKFAAAGLPNVDTLGPRGGNIHSLDEYLIPDSLVPRAKLVAMVLMSFVEHLD